MDEDLVRVYQELVLIYQKETVYWKERALKAESKLKGESDIG